MYIYISKREKKEIKRQRSNPLKLKLSLLSIIIHLMEIPLMATAKKKRDFKQERKTMLAREGRAGERKRAQAQRNAKKSGKRKTGDGSDAGHKKSAKSGGSSNASNLKKQSRSSNRAAGGRSGNKAGKASGGRKSSRKGVKNK